jgi:hypothetical protein
MVDKDKARQLLMQFSRELNGSHGKTRDYTSPPITVRGVTFCYYFTKKEVTKILNSTGSIELRFVESLYKFEEELEIYINNATEHSPILEYADWLKQKGIKIIIREGDIVHYRKRKGLC